MRPLYTSYPPSKWSLSHKPFVSRTPFKNIPPDQSREQSTDTATPDNKFRAEETISLTDLSFIEIVPFRYRGRGWIFRVINERLYPGRDGERYAEDGPLRDTDTNRDINTNRSFIFFYVPTRGTRRRRRRRPPRRILTRTRLRPCENFSLFLRFARPHNAPFPPCPATLQPTIHTPSMQRWRILWQLRVLSLYSNPVFSSSSSPRIDWRSSKRNR